MAGVEGKKPAPSVRPGQLALMPPSRPASRRLLEINKLTYRQTDIVQELTGAGGELIQELADLGAQQLQLGCMWVEMQNVLAQPAPELFDGVEPGGVGG